MTEKTSSAQFKTPFPFIIELGWFGCGITAVSGFPVESGYAFIALLIVGGIIFGKSGPEWDGGSS